VSEMSNMSTNPQHTTHKASTKI